MPRGLWDYGRIRVQRQQNDGAGAFSSPQISIHQQCLLPVQCQAVHKACWGLRPSGEYNVCFFFFSFRNLWCTNPVIQNICKHIISTQLCGDYHTLALRFLWTITSRKCSVVKIVRVTNLKEGLYLKKSLRSSTKINNKWTSHSLNWNQHTHNTKIKGSS